MSDTNKHEQIVSIWTGKEGYAIVDAGELRYLREKVARLTVEIAKLRAAAERDATTTEQQHG